MLRTVALAACLTMPIVVSSIASADDVKSKTPESAFSAKLKPDILGLSSDLDAAKAKDVIETHFKGRQGVKPKIDQQKLGDTAVVFTPSLSFDLPASSAAGGETIAAAFSSPASGNLGYMISRNLTFAQGQQPPKADMLKQVTDKYGAPTLIGGDHVYYFYRSGKVVSVKQKYKPEEALDALDKPINPKAAVALNDAKGQGSCVAAVKHVAALDTTLTALLSEAKDANCDGALSIALSSGATADRVGKATFMLVDFKRIVSAAGIDQDALAAAKRGQTAAPPIGAPKL